MMMIMVMVMMMLVQPGAAKKLASLNAPTSVDIRLVEKMKESEDAKNAMQTRYNQLFAQCQKALKENNELKEKIDTLVKELAKTQNEKTAAVSSTAAASAAASTASTASAK